MNNCLNILLAAIIFISCKNEKPNLPPIPDPNEPTISLEKVSGAKAVLQATYVSTLKQESQLGTYTFFEGIAHAKFHNTNAQAASVREVVCEGHILDRDKDIYQSSSSNTFGIDFGSATSWAVNGKGDVPSFSNEVAHKVPEIGDLNVKDSLNIKDSVWLKIDIASPFTNIGSADSIRISIIGKSAEFHYAFTSVNDSALITPDFLKRCGQGKAYLQAEAIHYKQKSYQGYPVAFVNKGMFYKPVWLY